MHYQERVFQVKEQFLERKMQRGNGNISNYQFKN